MDSCHVGAIVLLANARFSGDVALSFEPAIALAVVDLITGILMPGSRCIKLGGPGLVSALNSGVVGLITAFDMGSCVRDDRLISIPLILLLMSLPRIKCALRFS